MAQPRAEWQILFTSALVVALGASPRLAEADAPNKAAAEALFGEGRRLVAEGHAAEACPKFEESQRLDSSPGTLLNLGNCYEVTGRSASAWATYKEAMSVATSTGRTELVPNAQRRVTALEPKLSTLTILADASIQVTRDGVDVARPQFGLAIPVDPGKHMIHASAPGKKSWDTTVDVGANAAKVKVTVPPLEDAPVAVVPPQPVPPPSATSSSSAGVPSTSATPEPPARASKQRPVGWIVGGVGIVGLGVGGIFALSAKSKFDSSKKSCRPDNPNLCSSSGVSTRDDARSFGNIATVAMGIGGAALVTGIVLVVTAPSERKPDAVAVEILPAWGGLDVRGQW